MTTETAAGNDRLDVICIGRSSVDLYGQQVGGRLEDMASFAKYVGGCPTNISIGTARLGLKPAVITGVGDEHMGRFLLEQLAREGVDTSHVLVDPQRLTSLVVLGIRDEHTFPLIFYREDCADAALTVDHIDPDFIASAKAVVVTGTHFSTPSLEAMSRKAMEAAHAAGRKVVLDIDYRPVLWGLTGHGLGEERFVADQAVTERLQTILPGCDVVVGTEEELHIAGGTTETLEAIRRVRELSPALIVCKRGPMGCVAFPGEIPDDIEKGVKGPGFPVEVYNVLGAGDAFMSGFLRGYLRDLPLEESCRLANACGAFAVSRHGCAPAVPTWEELTFFLSHGSPHRALRKDDDLNRVHWSTTRRRDWPSVHAFAFDHRAQLEEMAAKHGADEDRIEAFKLLALKAARLGGEKSANPGILCDGRLGRTALDAATDGSLWIGRPIEEPGSRPLRFEGGSDVGSTLREWPVDHVVKCLVFYHPDDDKRLCEVQEARVNRLYEACRHTDHELLLEVIASKSDQPIDEQTIPRALRRFYTIGIYPDWWKLVPPTSQAEWQATSEVIDGHDPHCRGVLLLGLDAPEETLFEAFDLAAKQPICKGFAVGRTIFGATADDWLAGRIDDDQAVRAMAESFGRLIDRWLRAEAA
ncbi:MAG: 5-dehydro-2-deoxygluconokinase [Pseudomonadota bacterium]